MRSTFGAGNITIRYPARDVPRPKFIIGHGGDDPKNAERRRSQLHSICSRGIGSLRMAGTMTVCLVVYLQSTTDHHDRDISASRLSSVVPRFGAERADDINRQTTTQWG